MTSVSRSENAPGDQTGDNQILIAGPLSVDLLRYEVRLRGQEIRFTARELDLLVYLIRRAGSVASTDEISDAVWHGPTSTNTVTVHINRIRLKLGDDPQHGYMIRTVRGVGYRLAPSLCRITPIGRVADVTARRAEVDGDTPDAGGADRVI